MASIQLLDSVKRRQEQLASEAKALPFHLQAKLILDLASFLSFEAPRGVEVSLDGVLNFARAIHSFSRPSEETTTHLSSEDLAKRAMDVLKLPKGLTGPERALIAAVKLYHQDKKLVNARAINQANDEAKGGYIANISTAIQSLTKEGLLDEAATEGHSSFSVNIRGFSAFEAIYNRLQAEVTSENQGAA